MLKNYIKIAFRNLWKHKGYTAIHISGLAIGLACCILIYLFVSDELRYDRHHQHAGNIYRVTTDMLVGGNELPLAVTSFPMSPALKNDYPEIAATTRVVDWGNPLISRENERFYENEFWWADASIFEVFTLPLQKGDPRTALAEPNSVVLTEATALKYFGDENPLGKTLTYENQRELQVTGVLAPLPSASHLKFDFLGSFATLEDMLPPETLQSWHSFFKIYSYLRLDEKASAAALQEKLPQFVAAHMDDELARSLGRSYRAGLQPLTDIHLHSQLLADTPNGNIAYVYIFSAIAAFILLIACINFMNLATARSARRAREVGMRKVLGAQRVQLVNQFMGESILITLIALPLALVLAELFLPSFNTLSGKTLSMNFLMQPGILLIVFTFALFTGLAAGGYPALFLSRYLPIKVLKGGAMEGGGKGGWLRKGLVVFQFGISIALMIGTVVVYNQLEFMRGKSLGFDKEQIITLPATDNRVKEKFEVLRETFRQNPAVLSVGGSTFIPGGQGLATPMLKKGGNPDEKWEMATMPVNPDYLPTLGIKLLAGRNFSRDISSDESEAFIINRAAVKQFGWESPEAALGRQIEWYGLGEALTGAVIGVTEDFHFSSLHNPIAPAVMLPMNLWPTGLGVISVKTFPDKMPQTLTFLRAAWEEVFSEIPFRYSFLDEDFGKLYQFEEKLGRIFSIFAALAIFIACLGLFGLAAYVAEQRVKEIGIRKVLGATVPGLAGLLSKDFLKLIVVANILAWPLAWFAMNRWLEDFAYRIEVSWWVFLLSGGLALLIAILTVSYQAIRAALSNPVESLRYE